MSLRSPIWSSNQRLQRAADNKPPMRLFEPDRAAVTLLQRVLVTTGIAGAISVDGIFGPKTAAAVRAVQARFNMDPDEGVAGRQVLAILDVLSQGGQLGSALAQTDSVRAAQKVRAATAAMSTFKSDLQNTTLPASLTVDALRVHFRLTVGPPTIGVGRQVTDQDVDSILLRYGQVSDLLGASGLRFRTGVPVNGILTAAEAPLNGPITFGPAFADVDAHLGGRIGPNSRAAVLIHEAVHVFDADSGNNNTHISEFAPGYSVQNADLSLHNPSSFAGFAAHIDNKGDPPVRFGLGPGARGL